MYRVIVIAPNGGMLVREDFDSKLDAQIWIDDNRIFYNKYCEFTIELEEEV